MGDQIKNMLVGLIMIAACAFTVSLILFLKPSVGDGEKTYYVRFSNINGIGEGTRVMFAGKPVGEVVSVEEIHNARDQTADPFGRIYFYQLVIKVDSSVTIYNTDQLSIQTSGLLGEKSIAIIPVVPGKNVVPTPVGHEPIYAQSSDPLETAFTELSQLANEMEGTFRYLNNWLDKNGDTLAEAVSSFKNTLNQADKALSAINESGIIEEAKLGVQSFSQAMARMDLSLKSMEDGQFFEHMNKIAGSVQEVTGALADGKGTLGKLIQNEDLYLHVTSLLTKADTMMNDINHYGILFHLNKTWQRERLQRITLMNSLNTPESFKTYFEKEVDNVNLAMSRLSLLMEKANSSPEKEKIFQNKEFSKDFAQFLREIDDLSQSVQLYNEQLVQIQETH